MAKTIVLINKADLFFHTDVLCFMAYHYFSVFLPSAKFITLSLDCFVCAQPPVDVYGSHLPVIIFCCLLLPAFISQTKVHSCLLSLSLYIYM